MRLTLLLCPPSPSRPFSVGAAPKSHPPLARCERTASGRGRCDRRVATPAVLTQDLPGRLFAVRSAQVRARVEGVVEKRLFAEGSDVKAGTPLFQIDARTYQAVAEAAEADLTVAKANFDRYKPLLEIRAVSQQEYDLAQARVKQAEAAWSRAQLDLENAVPSAPISGRIGRALVTEGALVGKGEATHLATVEQLDPIRVEFTQAYSDLLRLQQASEERQAKRAESVPPSS